VIGIEEDIGRTGRLNFTGLLEPVILGGTTVTRIAFHNLKFINEMGIKKGCKIKIQKSGDIIPYVLGVVEAGTEYFTISTHCQYCNTSLVWDNTNTTKWCRNDSCQSRLIGGIEHWFKKLNVKGIGQETIKFLVENKYVVSLSDMYTLGDRLKEKLAVELGPRKSVIIIEAVHSVKSTTLAMFLEALGIPLVGSMAKEIALIAPTIAEIDQLTIDKVLAIPGFGEAKARSFFQYWKDKRAVIAGLESNISIEKPKMSSSKLQGKKFCFTGSFKNPSRGEMESMVPEHGGKLGSVGKGLTALIWDGAIEKGKYQKAKETGIPVITQAEFLALIQ
jgi:DNA ligase (NAD+)